MPNNCEIRIVLIAENKPFLHATTAFIDRHADVEVVGVFNGDEASLKRAQSLGPEVVLLDMDMASQNGLATINHLRALLPKVWIVALSLITSQGFRRATLAAGADQLVRKPNLSTELFPAIYQATHKARIEADSGNSGIQGSSLAKT